MDSCGEIGLPQSKSQQKQAPTPTQPATASAAVLATQSPAAQSSYIQSPKYCAICSPLGKLCPNEYPITADWPDDSEEGKKL